MNILNGYSGVVHNSTKIRDEGIGEIYKLSCGREVYVGILKTTYAITDHKVTCEKCLKKAEMLAANE